MDLFVTNSPASLYIQGSLVPTLDPVPGASRPAFWSRMKFHSIYATQLRKLKSNEGPDPAAQA